MARTLGQAFVEILPNILGFKPKLVAEAKSAGGEAGKEAGEAINARLRALRVADINLNVGTAEAMREIQRVERELNEIARSAPTAQIRVDAVKALADIARLKKSMDFKVEADVDVDKGLANGRRLVSAISSMTGEMRNSFQLMNAGGGMAAPIIAAGGAAALASPLVISLASSIGLAAGASAAVIPAVFGFVGVLGGLKLAFGGVGDAVGEYTAAQDGLRNGTLTAAEAQEKMDAALAGLSPAMRGMVVEIAQWRDRLNEAASVIQDKAAPAITNLLSAAATHLPTIRTFFSSLGGTVRDTVNDITAMVKTPLFAGQFQTIMTGNATAVGLLGSAIRPVLQAFLSIGSEATPILIRFAEWVKTVADRFALWIEAKRHSGELATFMKAAADEASKWGQIVGNFLAGFVTILVSANAPGRELSTNLLNISQRFREWATANTANLQEFFQRIKDLPWADIIRGVAAIAAMVVAIKLAATSLGAVNAVLTLVAGGPATIILGLVVALASAFAILYTKNKDFRDFIHTQLLPALREFAGWVKETLIPALKDLWHWFEEEILPTLKEMAERWLVRLRDMWDAFVLWYKENKGDIAEFVQNIKDIAKFVVEAVNALDKIGGPLGTFTMVLKLAGLGIDIFNAQIGGMKIMIDAVGVAASAVWIAIQAAWTFIRDLTLTVWTFIKDSILQPVVTFLTTVFTVAWTGLSTAVSVTWTAIQLAITTAWTFIRDTILTPIVTFLTTVFTTAWTALQITVTAVWAAIQLAITTAWTFIRDTILTPIITFLTTVFTVAWNGITTVVRAVWAAIQLAIQTAWTIISGILNTITGFLAGVFTAAWNALRAAIQVVWTGIQTLISAAWGVISGVFNAIIGFLSGAFTAAWNALRAAIQTVWTGIQTLISAAWNFISGIFNTITGFLAGAFTNAWNTFRAAVDAVWNAIRTLISAAWTFISGIFNTVIGFLAGAFTNAWNIFRALVDTVWNAIRTIISSAWTFISGIFNTVIGFLAGVFTTAWNVFRDMLNTLWNVIRTLINDAWNFIKGVFDTIIGFLAGTFSTAWQTFKDFVNDRWEDLKRLVSAAWDWVKSNVFDKMIDFVTKTIPKAFSDMKDGVVGFFDKMAGKLHDIWDGILGYGKKIINQLIGVVNAPINFLNKTFGIKLPTVPTLAEGGPVPAPGPVATSALAGGGQVSGGPKGTDTVPAAARLRGRVKPFWLDNGEHVWRKSEVDKVGGQGAMYRLREWVRKAPRGKLRGDSSWYRSHPRQAPPEAMTGGLFWGGAPGLALGAGVRPGMGRDLGMVPGIVAVYKKMGGKGSLSSGYRAGDPLWHGSGLAADLGGYNQDAVSSKLMSIGSSILELIHSGAKGNYGISMGKSDGMNAQLWTQHKNHVHLAMAEPEIKAILGGAMPAGVGGALGTLVKWLKAGVGKAAKRALEALLKKFTDALPKGNTLPDKAIHSVVGQAKKAILDRFEAEGKKMKDVMEGGDGAAGGPGSAAVGEAQKYARSLFPKMGWDPLLHWGSLQKLWEGESGWNYKAVNPSSGAYGIPQILPSAHPGVNLQNNMKGQIDWGLNYIKGRYSHPTGAYNFWLSKDPHWYREGGAIALGGGGDWGGGRRRHRGWGGWRKRWHGKRDWGDWPTMPIPPQMMGGLVGGGGIPRLDDGGWWPPGLGLNTTGDSEMVRTKSEEYGLRDEMRQVRSEIRKLRAETRENTGAVSQVGPAVGASLSNVSQRLKAKARARRGRGSWR